MNFIIWLLKVSLYKPLFNALVVLYKIIPGHDFGLAVILLTVITRIIIYPLMSQSLKNQKALSKLQPKIKEIQDKHKGNKERLGRELIALYQREKINPLGSFLPLIIQIPILIALYEVFWKGLQPGQMSNLYSFISQPQTLNPYFFGLINLSRPSLVLTLLAGVSQFFQSKTAQPPKENHAEREDKKEKQMPQISSMFQKEMVYFFPIFTVLILLKLPSAVALYWIVTALFSLGQQYIIFKKPVPAGPAT